MKTQIIYTERTRRNITPTYSADVLHEIVLHYYSATSRTYKAEYIEARVTIDSMFTGYWTHWFNKPTSINIKNPLYSKNMPSLKNNTAYTEAWKECVLSLFFLSKNIDAEVLWFNSSSGEGRVFIPSLKLNLPVFACNIKGAKTLYPNTACMTLKEGETVKVDLVDSGPNLLCVKVIQGGHFDSEHWDTIKDKNLAFRCDENGNAITGLFE